MAGYAETLGVHAYGYPLGVVYARDARTANAIAGSAGMNDLAAYDQVVADYMSACQRAHRALVTCRFCGWDSGMHKPHAVFVAQNTYCTPHDVEAGDAG